MDCGPKSLNLELRSRQGDMGSEYALESEAKTIKTLPSFLGDGDDKSKDKKLPSQRYRPTKTMEVSILANLLATPIKCTLPLADILKEKLELWKGVGICLKQMGIELATEIGRAHV